MWIPWAYQYGVGAVFFVVAILVAIRVGAVKLDRPGDKWVLVSVAVGFAGFMAAHALWIAVAG